MKLLMKIIFAVFLYMGLVGNAVAERQWDTCDILLVGPHKDGNQYIQLVCASTGTKAWYTMHPTVGVQGLAVALTALSLNYPVIVSVDPLVPYSEVYAIYIKKQ